MKQRIRERGGAAARRLGLHDAATSAEVDALRQRVEVLEEEVQEGRQLNLRLAELTDVVGELLLPVAHRDEARVAEVMEKYARGI
ncbi:MAG: DUF6752 domain-containing protein [Nocardioides sp.]